MPSQPHEHADAVARRDGRPPTMRELLASCAAADAVSTPPAPQRPEAGGDLPEDGRGHVRRDAA